MEEIIVENIFIFTFGLKRFRNNIAVVLQTNGPMLNIFHAQTAEI